MHDQQLGETLIRHHRRMGLLVAASLAALASTSAMAANDCAPVAQISPNNQVVNENALVQLNGNPSKDEDFYAWAQIAGPTVTLSSTTAAMITFTAPSVGPSGATLKFTLRVTGCTPAITSAPVETTITVLNVVNPNQPPVAAATVSPASIFTGYTVTLNGSGSSDPDGNSLTYSWVQIEGTTVALSNANTAMATFTAPFAPYPNGASLKFRLTVSDGSLQSSTEQIVNVLWQNAAPTAQVSCPASVNEGGEFTLNGSTSSDPDTAIASYLWSQTLGGPVAILPSDMTTPSIAATAPLLDSPLDTMSFKLEVTDPGELKDDVECDVKVNDITPPEADPKQSPAANTYGWNNTDVTVTWDWWDAGVGVNEANCPETSTSSGEGDPINLEATCSDLSGNEQTESRNVKVDKTKPEISAAATTLPNALDWYKANVAVKFTCTDGLSGFVSGACPANEVLDTEGAAVMSTAETVSDVAGNLSDPSNIVTVKIDKTRPSISAAATTSPNGNGWYKDDVTVQFTCTDTLSGIVTAGCPEDESLSGEGSLSSTTPTVSDNAGNVSYASNVVTVSIDKTKPTISAAATTSPNAKGWYKNNVTVDFTCADSESGSGVDPGDCPADQTLSNEGRAVASTAKTVSDRAGNLSDPSNVVTVKIDKTRPTITAAATSSPNSNGWYKEDVTVHFTCTDALSYIVTGSCPGDETLSDEGSAVASNAQTVSDNADNVSYLSNVVTVKIDKTKPTISAAATSSPNGNGWYKNDVTVDFTCADSSPGSGVDSGDCPADQTLSAEGNAVASTAKQASDRAGNLSDLSNVVTVKIDKTRPGINWAGGINGGDSFYFGSVPAEPTCAATDGLSGPDGCAVTGYTAAVGSHTLTATGHDKAGNETKVERQYTVKAWSLNGFYQPVDMGGVWNTVKGGSTVPLKFEVFAANELTDVGVVQGFALTKVSCLGSGAEDPVEMVTTGGTSLRYDGVAGQFIQNWQTPKTAGICYIVTMTTDDGSSLSANFKLK